MVAFSYIVLNKILDLSISSATFSIIFPLDWIPMESVLFDFCRLLNETKPLTFFLLLILTLVIVFLVLENFKMGLPKMNFGGQIVYCRTVTEVKIAADELLRIVKAKQKGMERAILGFDIEWRPTFKSGWFRNVVLVPFCQD